MLSSLIRMVVVAGGVLPSLVSAGVAVAMEPRAEPIRNWVQVDNIGGAATIYPSVTTSAGGATSTVNAAPSSLTQTTTYVAITGTQTSTKTGIPPVASATGTGQAGALLVCPNYKSETAPICQPDRGSQLAPGKTYYVTWDASWFGTAENATIDLEVQYPDGGGLTLASVNASRGFLAWHIDSAILTNRKISMLNASLFIIYDEHSGNINSKLAEPKGGHSVLITNTPVGVSGGSGVSALAIALPVVIGVVALGLLGFCVWSWRRHGRVPLLGGLAAKRRSRSGQGYGVRQSHSQRTGGSTANSKKGAGVGIQLSPTDSWSPTSPSHGRNVFREEVERQEREDR